MSLLDSERMLMGDGGSIPSLPLAEWTGTEPARFHGPYEAGSTPASATLLLARSTL